MCDNDGRVLKLNTEFTRLFEYSQEEAERRLVDDLIAPEELRESSRHYH